MLVFYKARLVVLSVPKTGTTAYHSALREHADIVISSPPELKHAPIYRYDRFFRPIFEKVCGVDMDIMAVVREPVSWLGSWYRYRRRPSTIGQPTSTHDVTFDEFVLGYLKGKRPDFANVGSQATFLSPRPGSKPPDFLFRYEDQARILDFCQDRIGRRPNLRHENVSPNMPLALSPGTEARLRRKCAAEFALYDSIS